MSAQMKYQKIITVLAIIASAVFFVLGLGFATNLYTLYYFIDPSSVWYVSGSEIYYDIQPFNHTEVKLAIVMILLAVSQLITLNHTRRKYYVSNYVTGIAFSVFSIYMAVFVHENVIMYKNQFLTQVDFDGWKMWVDLFTNLTYNDSTFWFDAAIVVSYIGVGIAVLTIINLIWKTVNMLREKKAIALYAGTETL